MPILNVTRNYRNGSILTGLDIDLFLDDVKALVNTTLLDDLNFQDSGISAVKIIDNTVLTSKIADSAVTNAKLVTDVATSDKLAADSVTTSKIVDLAVTTAKLATDSVTTAALADGAVGPHELAALGQQLSSSTSSYAAGSSAVTDITNATITITTTGRPVWVGLQADGDTGASNYSYLGPNVTGANGDTQISSVIFKRGASTIATFDMDHKQSSDAGLQIPTSAFFMIDEPAAGTYTYKAQTSWTTSASGDLRCYYAKLVAFEL